MGEKKQIRIAVKDKIACLVDKEQFLVCGNNDYEVVFDFDSDWEGISAKTAVFVYGNTPIHQPFVGNVCEGVEIKNATLCAIGVFAGDIKTTTGATIECRQSIRDIGGVPKPPSKEVYDEIMALLDKAIEAHTELPVGGKKGQVLKKVSDKDYDTEWANDEQRDLTEIEESLANKLDKTTEANKIYGTDAEGNQATLPVDTFAKRKAQNPNFYTALGYGGTPEETTFIMSDSATPNSIVYRDGSGNFKVNTPTDDSHPAPKGYVVAKTTAPSRLYGTNANGAQALHKFSQSVIPWFISARGERGELLVPYTPYTDAESTSKMYVDGLINPIEERVSDLEYLTLDYTSDTTTAYEKTVPADVGSKALIKSIGGASVFSNNLLDPAKLTSGKANITVNNDGSITFVVGAGDGVGISLPSLPIGTYYFTVEQDSPCIINTFINYRSESLYPFEITSSDDWVRVDFENMDWNGDGTLGVEDITVTAKFMLSTEEGVPFEPYFEPENVAVERVESIGANLIPFPYEDKDKTQKGITYTVLADGGIKCVGTPTGYVSYICSSNMHFEDGKTYYKSPEDLQIAYKKADGSTGYATTPFTWKAEYTLISVYIQISPGQTVDKIIYPMINVGSTKIPYAPYKAEPIDTLEIPEAVRNLDGYGREGSYIEWKDGKATFTVTKDENLEILTEPEVKDITSYFDKNKLSIQRGGLLRFVNKDKLPVPSHIVYVKRKG